VVSTDVYRCSGVDTPSYMKPKYALCQDRDRLLTGPVDADPQVILVVVGRLHGSSDERHEVSDHALDGGRLDLPALELLGATHAMRTDRGCEG
jgi:hypothetical protein